MDTGTAIVTLALAVLAHALARHIPASITTTATAVVVFVLALTRVIAIIGWRLGK